MRARVNPPIAWIGGKSRLAELIVAKMPDHAAYVEVFGGAGWVLFRKPVEKCEIYNDLDSELVNLYRMIKERYAEFLEEFKLVLVSRQIWSELKNTAPEKLSEIRRAARFFYLVKASFAGRGKFFGVRTDGPSNLNLKRLPELIEAVHERLVRVTIEHLDFRKLIPVYDRPETLFYLDPPYWGKPDYRHNMAERDFEELNGLLRGLKGKFLLSLNDHHRVREIFDGFEIETVTTRYSCARRTEGRRAINELLIRNY